MLDHDVLQTSVSTLNTFLLAAPPNPMVNGLKRLLSDIAGWMAILQIPVAVVAVIRGGMRYMSAEDPHEKRSVKERFTNIIIGVAIVGNAPWIGDYLLKLF